MNDSLYDEVVTRRRLFALLMVGGAVMLAVAVTLLAVSTYRGGPTSGPQPTQGSGVASSITQPPAQAAAPATPAAPSADAQQPAVVGLGMEDFTAACQAQYWDASAVAKIAPTSDPPSYWVKCFQGDHMLGGISLDAYCPTVAPGTRSDNPKRYDYTATSDGWLYWECVLA